MAHDQVLHSLVLAHAGNRRALRLIDGLRDATRLLGASTVDTSRSLHDIAAEHEPIVAAIEDGAPDRAADAMRHHVLHTARLLLSQAAAGDGELSDPARLWAEITG
jgi:DNA-binding GntR family transcriptional regulator